MIALSDWHLDETIKIASADGSGYLNRFGKAIAEERVSKLIRSAITVLGKYTEAGEVHPALTFWLGGDFTTGAIHPESRTITWCNPSKASAFAREQILRVLTEVPAAVKPSRIDVVCSVGNHERTTDKPSVTVPAGFSTATGLYEHLHDLIVPVWERNGCMGTWHAPSDEGPINYAPLSFGKIGRFLHGDARGFKFSGGVGGIAIPLNRFLGRCNMVPGAAGAITFVGHYHTFGWHENARAITNGSLCGFNGYAQSIGAGFEYPTQALAVLSKHDNMGPIAVHKLMCA